MSKTKIRNSMNIETGEIGLYPTQRDWYHDIAGDSFKERNSSNWSEYFFQKMGKQGQSEEDTVLADEEDCSELPGVDFKELIDIATSRNVPWVREWESVVLDLQELVWQSEKLCQGVRALSIMNDVDILSSYVQLIPVLPEVEFDEDGCIDFYWKLEENSNNLTTMQIVGDGTVVVYQMRDSGDVKAHVEIGYKDESGLLELFSSQ